MGHIKCVLKIIAIHGLKLNISKCSFAQPSIVLLAHLVSNEGISVDYTKIESIIKGLAGKNNQTQNVSWAWQVLQAFHRQIFRDR